MTLFLDFQRQSFFYLARSLNVEQRKTFVFRRQIFSQSLVKVCLMSIKTAVVASSYPAREKTVNILPRDLFPADACAYDTWISPGVALLISTSRFGKSVQTHLNFELTVSYERRASLIERIFWSQITS